MGILQKCFGGEGSSASSSSSRKQPHPTPIHHLLCHRFSLSQVLNFTRNFDQSLIVGEGIHGIVYRASISINGQLKHVAVKRFHSQLTKHPEGISFFKNEIIFSCQLHHTNLTSLVGFCDDHNEKIVVYDYASNGSLFNQLYSKTSSPTLGLWKKRLEISIGVARGLHYLHSGTKRTIIHLNTSPMNIILDENWVPKLSFFGLSLKGPKFSDKVVKPIEVECPVGTVGYIAPESYLCAPKVTHKSDVYSFGVVMLELVCGNTSLGIISQHGVRDLAGIIRNGEGIIDQTLVGQVAGECLKLYMDIAQSCLCEDPNERPDMGDVEVQLEHVLQLQEEYDASH